MKEKRKKVTLGGLILLTIISITVNSYAHSGKTDSSGGHKDNNNKSGLGSYHYHCGGHPPHLHSNGVCPYSSGGTTGSSASGTSSSTSTSSSSKTSGSTSTSSSSKTSGSTSASSTSKTSSSTSTSSTSEVSDNTSTSNKSVPTTIEVTSIQIAGSIDSIQVGENKKLAITITPDNATDKNVVWKSSDESIAMVSQTGEVIARRSGIANISVTSSNGKKDEITINVKEKEKVENKIMENSSVTNNNSTINNAKKQEGPNVIVGVLGLGLLGGGGYYAYKKGKKK